MAEEVKTDETKEKKSDIELSESSKKIMDSIESMSVMELATLVKALEDKFGVSASAPAVAVAVPGQAAGGDAPAEEKTDFDVILTSAGSSKIAVIKEVRAVTSLGLKEAKDLVEAAPKPIKEGATKEEADKIKAQIEKAGATVEIK